MADGGGFLEQEGIFLPEDQQGELDLEGTRGQGMALTLGLALALVAACTLMVVGAGGTLTWVGAGAAMGLFVAFAWSAGGSIDEQNRRLDEIFPGPTR